jgi:uncharacterized repeat protein (TIGR04076 family)
VSGRRVRCTVSSFSYSACGMAPGDWFEVGPDGFRMPDGQAFCYFAVAAVLPLVNGRLDREDVDAWLDSAPEVQCPDPPEALRMTLSRAPEQQR